MERRDRGFRTVAVMALLVAVVGISVAFAALSQTLTITGTSTLKGATWNIAFDNLQGPFITGGAEVETEAKLKNNSTTLEFDVSLKQPRDAITYKFDVVNNGTIAAEVSEVILTGVTEAEEANLDFLLTYDDYSEIKTGDLLAPLQTRALILRIIYSDEAVDVLEGDIMLDLGATIIYIQD